MDQNLQAPKGFNDVDLNPDSIDWEKTTTVAGTVVLLETLPTKRGDIPTMVIATEDGNRRVWESAGLRVLFKEVRPGDDVWITVAGSQALDGTKTMRLFKAARRQGEAPF